MMKPTLTTYHDHDLSIQTPPDVAVVVVTLLRETLTDAVRSLYQQDFQGSLHILIGIDQTRDFDFTPLINERPPHVRLTLFWPGYSTNKRHGGQYNAFGGGSLRTILTFLANARHVTYLDDDNWVTPDHIRRLKQAISDKDWAFTYRWFVHEDRKTPLCLDQWESVGPNRGVFKKNFGGFVDTNCLILDTEKCRPLLGRWSRSFPHQTEGRMADRHLFDRLRSLSYGSVDHATVSYVIKSEDTNAALRQTYIKKHALQTGQHACPGWHPPPKPHAIARQLSLKSGDITVLGDHQSLFDAALIIPTIGRKRLINAIKSAFNQKLTGRLQILVGLDKAQNTRIFYDQLKDLKLPDHVGLVLFDPGYSTSKRHGGSFEAYDGGALRTILSFLAHAPYVAYLDDDNSLHPHHIQSLLSAIQGQDAAFSHRQFIHPHTQSIVSIDKWESLGPHKGVYIPKHEGFIDPNCLMIRSQSLMDAFIYWTLPLPKVPGAMSADRTVFWYVRTAAKNKIKSTGLVSVDYNLQLEDPQHSIRKIYFGIDWICADIYAFKMKNGLAFDVLLEKRDQLHT